MNGQIIMTGLSLQQIASWDSGPGLTKKKTAGHGAWYHLSHRVALHLRQHLQKKMKKMRMQELKWKTRMKTNTPAILTRRHSEKIKYHISRILPIWKNVCPHFIWSYINIFFNPNVLRLFHIHPAGLSVPFSDSD